MGNGGGVWGCTSTMSRGRIGVVKEVPDGKTVPTSTRGSPLLYLVKPGPRNPFEEWRKRSQCTVSFFPIMVPWIEE